MNPETQSSASAGIRKILLLGPSALINTLCVGIINLGMIFIIREIYGASAAEVGWFGALQSFSYFSGCLLFRKFTSRLVPRNSMIFTTLASAGFFLFFLAFPGLPTAYIVSALFGLALSFFWPPAMGWLTRGLEDRELSRASGLYNLSWSAGTIISPYLAGILSQTWKTLPIWFAVFLFLLNAIFIGISRRFLTDADESSQVLSGSIPEVRDNSTPLRFPAWVAAFTLYTTVGIFLNIFPVFARGDMALSESSTGLLLTIRTFSSTAGFVILGRFFFWRFRKGFILLPPFLAVLFSLLLTFSGVSIPIWIIGIAGMGFASAWAYNNSVFYGASGAPDRNRRVTIHEALLNAGQILGSVLGGALYQSTSMGLVFLFLAALSLAGMVVQIVILRRVVSPPEPPASRG